MTQEQVRGLLARRVKRLDELLEISAPESLIAQEVVLVFQAGWAIMPTSIIYLLGRLLVEADADSIFSKEEQDVIESRNQVGR